jgi:hypothetical protein
MAAVAVALLTEGLWYYERLLGLRVTTLLASVGGGFVLGLGLISWFLVRTQRAAWQDNPLAFLLLATSLAQITALLSDARTAPALALLAVVLSFAAALAVSTMIHLARYRVRDAVIGLALGLFGAELLYVLTTPWWLGLSAGRTVALALCLAPFMLAGAVLSARRRLVAAPAPAGTVSFLQVAAPLWGLLALAFLI